MSRILRDLLVLVAVFTAVWFGVTFFIQSKPDVVGNKEESSLTSSLEKELGEVYLKQLESQIIKNDSLNALILEISDRVSLAIDSSVFDFQFYVVDSPEVNAYTSFGGMIFINTGLIDFLESPEELAAILAHELGHAQLKHVSTKLVRELGITILLTAATGGDPTLVQEMIKTITSSGFDRSMEKEADMFAFELLQKANVKPSNLTKTFIRLNTLNPSELDKFDIFLSHPNLKTRIDYLSSRTLDSTFQEVPIPVQWETVQEITNNPN